MVLPARAVQQTLLGDADELLNRQKKRSSTSPGGRSRSSSVRSLTPERVPLHLRGASSGSVPSLHGPGVPASSEDDPPPLINMETGKQSTQLHKPIGAPFAVHALPRGTMGSGGNCGNFARGALAGFQPIRNLLTANT